MNYRQHNNIIFKKINKLYKNLKSCLKRFYQKRLETALLVLLLKTDTNDSKNKMNTSAISLNKKKSLLKNLTIY